MKRVSTLLISLVTVTLMVICSSVTASEPSPYYIEIPVTSRDQVIDLEDIVFILTVEKSTVHAYADSHALRMLDERGYEYTISSEKATRGSVTMAHTVEEMQGWDAYPTWPVYQQMMTNFANQYQSICKLDTLGVSLEGREILILKISDNVDQEEAEPEVMYTSTMHGDETAGYILMLRLIDLILTGYTAADPPPEIVELVNGSEIYINPLANPDCTYAGGDETVENATRGRMAWVNGFLEFYDLNSNFPDPEDGPHPDTYDYELETIAMMDFAERQSIVLSANFHGGKEVVNYPWDYKVGAIHPDEDRLLELSLQYRDSAWLYGSSGYMTFEKPYDEWIYPGVVRGWVWYPVSGGRQDYMTYFHGSRELTIELSSTKLVSSDDLPDYWDYNRVSLLTFLGNVNTGIRGIVADEGTDQPIPATIEVLGRDTEEDRSYVYTDPDIGDFYRLVPEGASYDLRLSAPGYYDLYVPNVSVPGSGYTDLGRLYLTPLPLDAPTLLSPGDGTSSTRGTPRMTWEPVSNAVQYNIVIDDDLDFSSPHADVNLDGTSWFCSPELENVDQTWYWRLRSRNSVGAWGDWSEVWTYNRLYIDWICGDADGDGAVSMTDITYIRDYVFSGGEAPHVMEAADANCDGSVNIGDAVYLVNYLYKQGPPPCAQCS